LGVYDYAPYIIKEVVGVFGIRFRAPLFVFLVVFSPLSFDRTLVGVVRVQCKRIGLYA
jgi:hypothetical protein